MFNKVAILTGLVAGVFLAGCTASHNVQSNRDSAMKTGFSGACDETQDVTSSGRVGLEDDSNYRKARAALLDDILVDAIGRVHGTKLRARSETEFSFEDGVITDDLTKSNIRKIHGYVESYSFPVDGEKIVREGGERYLSMTVNAKVCIPENRTIKDVVALGEFKFEGRKAYGGRVLQKQISAVFPKNSGYILTNEKPSEADYDWLVNGEVQSWQASVKRDTIRSIFGGIVRTGSGEPIVDPYVYEISVTSVVSIDSEFEKAVLSDAVTLEETYSRAMSEDARARKIDLLIIESLKEAAKGAFRKLVEYK